MSPLQVTVRPVDDTALFIFRVFTKKRDAVVGLKPLDAPSHIDVVRSQQSLPRGEPENKTLVFGALTVIRQNPDAMTNTNPTSNKTNATGIIPNTFCLPLCMT